MKKPDVQFCKACWKANGAREEQDCLVAMSARPSDGEKFIGLNGHVKSTDLRSSNLLKANVFSCPNESVRLSDVEENAYRAWQRREGRKKDGSGAFAQAIQDVLEDLHD